MTSRTRLHGLWPALLVLTLAGCGTEHADAGGEAPVGAPDPAELEARAAHLQTRTDHVYVTEIPGYTLALQSVGVLGDDGFGSSYTDRNGHVIQLGVERAAYSPADCGEKQPTDGSPGYTVCEHEDDGWYSATALGHAYARTEGDVVVTVSAGLPGVDRATLRTAADAAHRADDAELDKVLPPLGEAPGSQPIERGDLPPNGDGAPNNEVGASG
ncbi:hypothetical protein [Streptomyces sp. AM 2-1-1]|uniref:hypothetical protein n=1 Tax=unclassified Streptomyces TaxID=2593676 RepID=UPI0023B8E519|nr:hypothetical protein [Streptomyces sp. AM 2-1-1]WEH39752.1 hypothetical protein PZB77_09610 [Streptomyces sp. AM 2-1-1]